MRPQQQNRRMRGRNNNNNNNNNRKGPNPLTRSYESNGPDVKIRGSAQQIADKYMQLARDAQGAGDRVMAENYLQHAEHYNRIIAAAQAQMPVQAQRDMRDDMDDDEESFEGQPAAEQREVNDGTGPQPEIAGGFPSEASEAEAPAGENVDPPREANGANGHAAASEEGAPRRPRRRRSRRQDGDANGAEAGGVAAEGADAPAPVAVEAVAVVEQPEAPEAVG